MRCMTVIEFSFGKNKGKYSRCAFASHCDNIIIEGAKSYL